jgi:hypothetical protein
MSASDEKVWQTTAVQNLVRYAPSGFRSLSPPGPPEFVDDHRHA